MTGRSSRYEPVRRFAPRPDGTLPFAGILPRAVDTPEGAIEHVLRPGDTLQSLAHEHYNDSRLWYRILDANPQLTCGADLRATETGRLDGEVVVIPEAPR
jgi:nucleoid-associated protein YgaU